MNVFDLVAKISLDTSEYDKGLDDASDKASSFGSKAGKVFGTAAKVTGAAVAAGATAVAGLVKSSVSAYGEYEQLVGGVETLFGTGGKSLEEFAKTAKATASDIENSGIDWDKYADSAWMQQGGGVSGLFDEMKYNLEEVGTSAEELQQYLQSEYDLDTEDAIKAVKAYQNAITDESVKNKYDAQMKAQKEVLDNAANAYKTAGLSANEYMQTAIDSSAAMINSLGGDTKKAAEMTDMAITDMADNANKMGTSMESLQNAYKGFSRGNFQMLDNLSLGFAGTKDGMQELLNKAEELSGVKYDISSYSDIVEAIHVVQTEMGITGTTALEASNTIQGSAGSVKAAWENLVTGLGDSNADLDTLVGNFIDSLSTMGENLLPIIEKALEGVAKLIEKLAPIIADKIPELVPKIVPPLLNAATKIVAALVKALPSLIKVLVQQIPSILAQLGQAILSAAPQILGAVVQIGGQILAFIPKLFMDLLNLIITGVTNILSPVIDFVRTWAGVFGEIFANLWNIITTIFAPAIAFFQGIWEGISTAFAPVIEFFSSIFQGAWDNIQSIWNAVTGWFSGVWDGIVGVFSGVASWFGGVFQSAWDAVTGIWEGITSFFSGVWDTVVGIFKDAGVAVGDAISGAVKGAVNAVLKGAVGIINGFIKAINVAISVINAIPGVKISKLSELDAPQLEEGIGLAKKGKQYLLEGKGKEAVIPIDKDQKWTKKVAGDMITALGGNGLAGGDIIIPVYIGNDRIQEIVIKANQINSFRNGGVA